MTELSITVNSSDAVSLEEAKALIERLLTEPVEPDQAGSAGIAISEAQQQAEDPDDLAQRVIDDLWRRTGESLHELLSAMAAAEGWFSMADIATETGETVSKTVSRFASLGRSVKAARNNVPGAPRLFDDRKQPDGSWNFRMPDSVRKAIHQAETRS